MTEPCVRVDRLLQVSTAHMPDLGEDLTPFHWGVFPFLGYTWLFAYEDDDLFDGRPIPRWLWQMCVVVREQYECDWFVLQPNGNIIPELPIYQHD